MTRTFFYFPRRFELLGVDSIFFMSLTKHFVHGYWQGCVIKSRGRGIFPGYYECGPQKKSLGVWFPVVLTRHLEILVTTLGSATKKLLQRRIDLKQQYIRDIAPLTA